MAWPTAKHRRDTIVNVRLTDREVIDLDRAVSTRLRAGDPTASRSTLVREALAAYTHPKASPHKQQQQQQAQP